MSSGWLVWRCSGEGPIDKTLTWKTGTPPAPVNVTGYEARVVIRRVIDAPVVEEWSTDSGHVTLGGALGTLRLQVPRPEVQALHRAGHPEQFVMGIEMIPPGDNPDRELIDGWLVLDPEVAR